MSDSIKTDDVIFNFFKQICDETDEKKCVDLGNSWINAMETNLDAMEANLSEADILKHKNDIQNNSRYNLFIYQFLKVVVCNLVLNLDSYLNDKSLI